MAGDIELGIRLTGDGKGLVGEVRISEKEMEKLGNTTKATGDKSKRAASFISGMGGAVRKTRSGINGLANQLFSLKGLLVGLGVGAMAKSFLTAASTAEQYRIRLQVMLGSQAEGNRLFKEMAEFAGKVPFEYENIMASATQLSGVVKGGVDEIKQWMPLISDLAATSGLSLDQTTQQVIRMMSAGAGSADLFRERGVLAMLGFEAGVTYSAEETTRKLQEEWMKMDSQFRGATDLLADSWEGMTSMISDKWFQTRTRLMDAGLFDYLKSIVQVFNRDMDQALDDTEASAESWANAIIDGLESALGFVGVFADGIQGLRIIFKGVEVIFWGFVAAVGTGVAQLNNVLVSMTNTLLGWVKDALSVLAPFSDSAENALQGITALQASFSAGAEQIESWANTATNNIRETLAEMDALAQFLPSDVIKTKLSEIREQFELNRQKSREAANATVDDSKRVADAVVVQLQQQTDAYAFLDDAEARRIDGFKKVQKASTSAARSFEDDWVESIKNAEFSFSSFADSVIDEMLRMQAQASFGDSVSGLAGLLFDAISGGSSGYDGGTASGPRGGAGGSSVRTFAHGGIASSPQLAIFGEGSQNEAFVPLPDGRRIPVQLSGQGGGGGMVVEIYQENDFSNVSSVDEPRIQQMLDTNKEQTKAEVFDVMNRGGAASRAVGRR